VATNVREAVVTGSGHWLMEERPEETVALIRNFPDSPDAGQTAARWLISTKVATIPLSYKLTSTLVFYSFVY